MNQPEPRPAIALPDLGAVIVRRWRLMFALPVAAAVVAVGISLFFQSQYKATIAFATESRSSSRTIPAALAGLGQQLGLQLTSDPSTRSPRFFVEIVTSREILEQVLHARYPRTPPADSITILEMLDLHKATPAATLEASVAKLRDRIAVVLNTQTNIAQVTVTLPDAVTSAAVANSIVQLVDRFNRENLQSQAHQRRIFVEGRKAQALEELDAAEERLRQFLKGNSTWQQSPVLQLEHDKLERQVQVVQEVYLTLAREYETSRIQEVDDQSVISVVDSAVVPAARASPRRGQLAVLGVVLGFLIALGVVVAGAYWDHAGAHDESMQRLLAEIRRAASEMTGGKRSRA